MRDRRPFAPDGSRRTGAEPRSEAPASTPPPGPKPEPSADAAPGSTAAGDGDSALKEDPRFKQLVSFFISQAAMLLDRMPDADDKSGGASGPRRAEALQGLQTVIGLLEVIEEKTRGRLAPGDSRLVSRALYELRMAYMEHSQSPST